MASLRGPDFRRSSRGSAEVNGLYRTSAICILFLLGLRLSVCWTSPSSGQLQVSRGRGLVSRRVSVDGPYGVLPEDPAPVVQLERPDRLLECLIKLVQAADKKRGVDMSAFWIDEGSSIVVMVTGLSRPQLQAIANEIDQVAKKELRLKRSFKHGHHGKTSVQIGNRDEAATGWVCMVYPRLTINIMTPSQRSYYNIEAIWRDDNEDYEKIPLDELLREAGFGNMRITRELQDPNDLTPDGFYDDYDGPELDDDDEPPLYEEDEDDPFWS